MIVYRVKLVGFNGPCAYDKLEDALQEIRSLMEEGDTSQTITITEAEMTEEEYESLEDFEGY